MSTSVIRLENLAAAQKPQEQELLGHLVWYTLSECAIDRDILAGYLRQVGLSESYLPQAIRVSDAFRRATTAAEKKHLPSADPKVFNNYLVREVFSDQVTVERHIAVETVDSTNKRLTYNECAAKITLDKRDGHLSFDPCMAGIEEIYYQIISDFEVFRSHYDSRAIRSMVYAMLRDMAPIAVRPSGGVYFIPCQHLSMLERMVDFISLIGGQSECFMIPLIDCMTNRDMVRQKINDQLRQTVQLLARSIKDPAASKRDKILALEQGKQILQNFRQYQDTLDDELVDMNDLTDLMKHQVVTLVNKLTEEE